MDALRLSISTELKIYPKNAAPAKPHFSSSFKCTGSMPPNAITLLYDLWQLNVAASWSNIKFDR